MKKIFHACLKIGLPFGIWCFLFQSFLSGKSVISSETFYIYSIVKFYIDNLKLGVFSLWDPFAVWGTPIQIFFNYVGIFNPFWLFIPILDACGLNFYQAFIFTLALYFWVGQLGFYFLAKFLLKNSLAAYFAFLLFLFSVLSMTLFLQYHPPLIYIPSIWFFFFLFSFFQNPQRASWIGLTLTTGLILTSYLPFYFLTVFTIVIFLTSVFYYSMIKENFFKFRQFVQDQVGLVILSLGVLILSFAPGFLAYKSTVAKEVVAPFRNQMIEKNAGVDFSNYLQISINALTARMDLQDVFSNLDAIQYGDDCYFYVSMFFFIVLVAGAFVRINKKIAIGGLTALILFFLMITNASGFHRFFFAHVPYFKLIRNMHFFLPYFLGVLIILAAEQFRVILENREVLCQRYRWWVLATIVLFHFGFLFFLREQEYVIFCSYLTVGLSFLFWIFFIADQKHQSIYTLPVFLFLSVVVQPMEVIWRHNQDSFIPYFYPDKETIVESVKIPSVRPVFSYARPVSSMEMDNDDISYCRVVMKDAPRFFSVEFPTYWSFHMSQKVPFDVIQKYTAYKFYLYDGLKNLEDNVDLEGFITALREGSNVAFVSSGQDVNELAGFMHATNKESSNTVSVIFDSSEEFQVTYFDVNSIKFKTRYADEKFLVYTDSFHRNWKAFINGKNVTIYRANMAFKGIRLPPGSQEVYLRYMPEGVWEISVLLIFIFLSLFLFLLWTLVREYTQNKISSGRVFSGGDSISPKM